MLIKASLYKHVYNIGREMKSMSVVLEDLGQDIKRLQHRHHRTARCQTGAAGNHTGAVGRVARDKSASQRLVASSGAIDVPDRSVLWRPGGSAGGSRVDRSGRRAWAGVTPLPHSCRGGLLNKGRTVLNKVLSESFAPLSPTELDTLYDLLTRLLHGPDAPPVE